MSVLELFNFSENFEVLFGVLKLLTLDSNGIVKLALQCLLCAINLLKLIINLLLNAIPLVVLLFSLLVQLLLSCLNLHESACILIVVLLELLQLTSFLE